MFEVPALGKLQNHISYKCYKQQRKYALNEDEGQEELKIFVDFVRTACSKLPDPRFINAFSAIGGPFLIRGEAITSPIKAAFSFTGANYEVYKPYHGDISIFPWAIDRSVRPPHINMRATVRATSDDQDEFLSGGFWKKDDTYTNRLRVRAGHKQAGCGVFQDFPDKEQGKVHKYCFYNKGKYWEIPKEQTVLHIRFKASPEWAKHFADLAKGVENGHSNPG